MSPSLEPAEYGEPDLPAEIDTGKPHSARIYDYLLGGKDNFAADRAAADAVIDAVPTIRASARENRAFLGRAVRYLTAEAGISQFLDIGSGLPGAGNVHEVAQAVNPAARVVYVDNDPLVLAHARALLTSSPEGRCAYVDADLREPERILADPAVTKTLDFSQPVALLIVSTLHFILDEDEPRRIMATFTGALPSGSYVVASHGTSEYMPDDGTVQRSQTAFQGSGLPFADRDMGQFADLVFTGLELVPPGITLTSEWRPPAGPRPLAWEIGTNAGVARKA